MMEKEACAANHRIRRGGLLITEAPPEALTGRAKRLWAWREQQ